MSVGAYLWRCGEALDQFLNVVLLDGELGETVSLHAAVDASHGKLWACWLCRWLSWTVEKNHCVNTLGGVTVKPRAGLQAGLQLFALALALSGLFWWAVLRP